MRKIRTTTIAILAVGLLAGSTIGVAAQDEPSIEVAQVTGRAVQTGELEGEDFGFLLTWTTSDPRLSGAVTRTVNFIWDPNSDTVIDSHTYELANDGGSWLGDGNGYTFDAFGDARSVQSVALSGRGGHEGLSAFVVLETASDAAGPIWDIEGVIISTGLPEVPERYAAE